MSVVLGFVTAESNDEEFYQTYYGGIPQYLGQAISKDQLVCGVCDKQMSLLLQLYAPEDDIPHAYHRIVYAFVCKDGQCMTQGQSKSIKVFRAQSESEVKDMKQICHVCGLKADRSCDGCPVRYCSTQHKQLHNDMGHSKDCADIKVKYGFKQHYIVSDEEVKVEEQVEDLSLALMATKTDDFPVEDFDMDTKVDKMFLKFQKKIRPDVHQVLRYARSGESLQPEPLLVSSNHQPTTVPPCPLCDGPRNFEFQIMPQILMHLDIKHTEPSALDFGTILVYTCINSCRADLTEEVAWQQPFSEEGINQ